MSTSYVIVFMAALLSCLFLLTAAAFYIQPLEGELTRLGSYAERDFGWNLPQKKIRGDAHEVQNYKEQSDVLIVGDINPSKISKFIAELEKAENKELRYTVMPLNNYRYRLQINDRFIGKIKAAKKQIIINNLDLPV